jgi:hypothetical protein
MTIPVTSGALAPANNPADEGHAQVRSSIDQRHCGWMCTCGEQFHCALFGYDSNTAGDPTEAPMYEPPGSWPVAQAGSGLDMAS